MTFQISQGIKINVEIFYQPEQSNPLQQEHLFSYRITIENHNTFTVRLLSRHWYIFDSNGTRQEVEGEGVIGSQPYIESENAFQYVSGVNLVSEMGRMYGEYTMENQTTKELFKVMIPAFELIVPDKMN
ncbi:Co2+/Mg2+ efflux protein ApaG [Arachidicoccus soli]|uniref:Co2+/Mg2+ efflux protein ApaG n=1 Tax=Arachidicoccus soli TaxID=2341117 RepID=A0A386HRC5_9BACT|nr:Co2+/Mg2+ efflux protein ApaG [Arachidicoccus soli]AYD48116.1 Co2+/Mg2+ efflux protein ApaG [Arachidicoccus soli]